MKVLKLGLKTTAEDNPLAMSKEIADTIMHLIQGDYGSKEMQVHYEQIHQAVARHDLDSFLWTGIAYRKYDLSWNINRDETKIRKIIKTICSKETLSLKPKLGSSFTRTKIDLNSINEIFGELDCFVGMFHVIQKERVTGLDILKAYTYIRENKLSSVRIHVTRDTVKKENEVLVFNANAKLSPSVITNVFLNVPEDFEYKGPAKSTYTHESRMLDVSDLSWTEIQELLKSTVSKRKLR